MSCRARADPDDRLQPNADYDAEVFDAVADEAARHADAMSIADKNDRNLRLDEIKAMLLAELAGTDDAPGTFAGRDEEVK